MIKTWISLSGETILQGARRAGIVLQAPCSGRGRCGKCRLDIVDSPKLSLPTHDEAEILQTTGSSARSRLACQTRCDQAGLVSVSLPDTEVHWSKDAYVPAPESTTEFLGNFAVDLGTTTIVAAAITAKLDTPLAWNSQINRQVTWGSDVISRIDQVQAHSDNLLRLCDLVVHQIEELILELLSRTGRKTTDPVQIAIAGNTVMLHLLLGEDPTGMAALPFRPRFLEARTMSGRELGFGTLAHASVEILPGISAFVGADIAAGILATGIDHAEHPELLIDLGTNGEMVLGNHSGLLATATAAGPAWEGAAIRCGSGAIPGAIDHVGISDQGLWVSTIGEQEPTGLCGSGLLDAVAALLEKGVVDETGRLVAPTEGQLYRLTDKANVFLTQEDLRQVQLAKGAIAAGIRILCEERGISIDEIARVHLAGGFGTFLNPVSAGRIGLIPPALVEKTERVGNTALMGAGQYLLSTERRTSLRALTPTVQSLDLARHPAFFEVFAEEMFFPEAT